MCRKYIRLLPGVLRVHARRARKSYPMDSMELNRELGGAILAACPGMRVDVHQPDIL